MIPALRRLLTSLSELLEPVSGATETLPRGEVVPISSVGGAGLTTGTVTPDDPHNAPTKDHGPSNPSGGTPADPPGKATHATSMQHKLDRIRMPPIGVTYDVEFPGGFIRSEL